MSKILKDPLAVKKKTHGDFPWDFKAPSYDNRTSCSMSAGDDYGIGHTCPLGKETASPIESGPIPQKSEAFSPDRIFHGEDRKG